MSTGTPDAGMHPPGHDLAGDRTAGTDLPPRLAARLQALADTLATRGDALGLLGLGSVGVETARADAWSDLDFFVVVEAAAKPRYLENLSWLAEAHPLAWSFRNTADGHKALMADGVFCEFAVFAPGELATVPFAPGRWIWRRDTLPTESARPVVALPAARDRGWLLGEALSNLLVGLMRHARGERLAAMRMVQVYALDRVLELAALDAGPAAGGLAPAADPFGPERRIEQRDPDLAAGLPRWAPGYDHTVAAALSLLGWLRAHHPVPGVVAARIEDLATAGDGAGIGPVTPR